MRPSTNRFLSVTALLLGTLLLSSLLPGRAFAFTKDGCGAGECRDCHSLSKEEAGKLLSKWVDNVTGVKEAAVKGLYAIDAEKEGRKGTLYMDFAKRHVLVVGQVVRIDTGEDVSQARTVDLSSLPLDRGMTLGKGPASKRIVILSDPDCHFCRILHEETKKVRARDPEVSFTVLLFSRNNDEAVARRAAAALCAGTEEALDRAYEGKDGGNPSCGTEGVAAIYEAAGKMSLRGTPVMIFPDGRVVVGAKEGEVILKILAETQGKDGKAPGAGGTAK
jgi:thiol:disulfide interchange protein DsbC